MLKEKPKLKRPDLHAFAGRHGKPQGIRCPACKVEFSAIGARVKIYQCPECEKIVRVKR